MSFANVPLSLLKTPPQNVLSSALSGVTGGLGAMQKLRTQNIANQLRQAQTTQLLPAKVKLLLAQAAKQQATSRLPGGGANLPGPAGQIQGIEILKQMYGANSPQVLSAQRGFMAAVKQQEARAVYFQANHWLKNLPKITTTQMVGNWQNDQAQRQKQNLPVMGFQDWFETQGRQQLTPEQQKLVSKNPPALSSNLPLDTEEQNVNNIGIEHAPDAQPVMHQNSQTLPSNLQVKKEDFPENFATETKETHAALQLLSSDPATRAKALNFQTINQLIGGVDPSIITTYAGPTGLTLRTQDRAAALAGQKVPRYEKYNTFADITVPTIADKIRQAYGTSITPEMFNILKNVSNPISWHKSPRMAMSNWNKLTQLMQEQGSIFNHAISAPISTTFIGAPGQKLPGQPVAQPRPLPGDAAPTTGTIKIRLPDGRVGSVPTNSLDKALKMGAKRI